MQNDYLKYYHPKALIVIVAVIAIGLFLTKDQLEISVPITGAITLVLYGISNWLWKYPPFKWMFWFDDFSGRYEGQIQYQYIDTEGKTNEGILDQVKIINQRGNKITVTTFTKRTEGDRSSMSTNIGLHLQKTQDEQHYEIIFNYLNEGCQQQGFHPHYGTEVLKFMKSAEGKELSGRYYTERSPFQTKGQLINMKWVSDDLKHEF